MCPSCRGVGFALLVRVLGAVMIVGGVAPSASPSRTPPLSRTGKTPVARAIEALRQEAQRIKAEGTLPVSEADFASRCVEDIARDDVADALLRRCAADAFEDAYIRWQLTSFNPPLPDLDDRLFFRLMGATPPMLPNPAADDEVVSVFQRARERGPLTERDVARLRETWTRVQREAHKADALNAPARQWREWIEQRLPDSGPRRLQWRIERCAATVSAGWPAREVKGEITKAFRAAGAVSGTSGLGPQQRLMVAEQTQMLRDLRRRSLEDVAFLASGAVEPTFANYVVDADDVERWVALLNGEQAP